MGLHQQSRIALPPPSAPPTIRVDGVVAPALAVLAREAALKLGTAADADVVVSSGLPAGPPARGGLWRRLRPQPAAPVPRVVRIPKEAELGRLLPSATSLTSFFGCATHAEDALEPWARQFRLGSLETGDELAGCASGRSWRDSHALTQGDVTFPLNFPGSWRTTRSTTERGSA